MAARRKIVSCAGRVMLSRHYNREGTFVQLETRSATFSRRRSQFTAEIRAAAFPPEDDRRDPSPLGFAGLQTPKSVFAPAPVAQAQPRALIWSRRARLRQR